MMTQPDAIIVGSGAGGAAAAYGLVRAGLRVLLLEKGAQLPTDGSTLDVARVVHAGEFLSREPWMDGRGQAIRPEEHFNVGGKTKWYGAALLRFARREFEADAAHGCRAWPIGFDALEPYYREAEQLLGVRTFECEPDLKRILARAAPVGSAWESRPMPLGLSAAIVGDRHEAMHFDGFASVRNFKGEAESSFLSRLAANARFTLLSNAEASGLIAHAHAPTTIIGVHLADGRELHAPRVLLAAGALHSPRLLERHVQAHSLTPELPAAGAIGRNLKLHLLTAMVAVGPRRVDDLIRKTTLITHARFSHSSVQPLGFDAELIASLFPRWLPRVIARQIAARSYGFFLQTEDGSDARNQVRNALTSESRPVLDYTEQRLSAARREHRKFTHAFQRRLASAGLMAFTRRIDLNGTAHACGSLVCGSNPKDSVVDAQGRVHGMRGLYVVDGSVLPRSSRVNPSLTIYAWALRCAALIARENLEQRATARRRPEVLRAL
jgi:choline dehydrogenase-like flavoprotein